MKFLLGLLLLWSIVSASAQISVVAGNSPWVACTLEDTLQNYPAVEWPTAPTDCYPGTAGDTVTYSSAPVQSTMIFPLPAANNDIRFAFQTGTGVGIYELQYSSNDGASWGRFARIRVTTTKPRVVTIDVPSFPLCAHRACRVVQLGVSSGPRPKPLQNNDAY